MGVLYLVQLVQYCALDHEHVLESELQVAGVSLNDSVGTNENSAVHPVVANAAEECAWAVI